MYGIPTELELQALTNLPISTGAALKSLTLKAIYTAAQAGNTTTAAISTAAAGTTTHDVEELFEALQSQGLQITPSATTFTVSW